MTDIKIHPASYKDPAGFIFLHEETIYRQVNQCYAERYEQLMHSGLYDELIKKNWMLPHRESEPVIANSPGHYKTLLPEQLPFTSYAYEWSFDMLKDAALLTLKVCRLAVEYGMLLKDASPYNIQFHKGKPVFIDTLSFEIYDATKPWIAYRQFCEMFLFPLYFEHYLKADINKILSTYIDGIPVALTAKLLPLKSNFSMSVWLHVRLQNHIKHKTKLQSTGGTFNQTRLLHLLRHLETSILAFKTGRNSPSIWSNYYQETIISEAYLLAKEKLVKKIIKEISFATVLDLGANDGHFSLIMAAAGKRVVAVDFDNQCINQLYRQIRKNDIANILPLNIDLANPSPAIGFNNSERQPFLQRAKSELVLALALIHHLVFTKNINLSLLAPFFNSLCKAYLLIEFVPMEDEKVQTLIEHKSKSTDHYNATVFETSFTEYFHILKKEIITGSERVLYLMEKKHQ